jgi:hypothetical protein
MEKELFSLVLDTFCICKSKAFQIQNTQSDGSGNMELKNVKLRAKNYRNEISQSSFRVIFERKNANFYF